MTDKPRVAVHDPLRAKAVVFDNGSTKIAVVATDLGNASDKLVTDVRRLVQEQVSIPPGNVLINASHNHRTHGQVAEDAAERIAQAVSRAADSMVPVKIGICKGREDRITMNRRLQLKEGKEWTIRRANPSPRDEDVTGVGPMDPEIGILRVDRAEGGTLSVLYNFACHPYAGVPDGGVTADLPGFASHVVENGLSGSDTVALFLQGAAGDITPIRYKDWDAPPHTEQFGTILGLSVLEAARQAVMTDDSRLQVLTETIALPRRTDLEQCLTALEAQQEEILQFFTGVGCGTYGTETSLNFKTFLPLYLKHIMDPNFPSYSSDLYMQEKKIGRRDLQHLDADNKQRIGKYLASIHNMERLIRIRNKRQLIQRQIEKGEEGPLQAEVQVIRIGDLVLVSFPGEAFCEVGLNIKQQSPFEFTFLTSYSNGSVGYAPTADAYGRGSYEDTLTRLAPEWQAMYEKKALEMIGRLR
jgi:hypothetical protein